MRKVLFLTILATLLWSYEAGDRLDSETAQKLQLQQDKTYIIDFFASWCISCKHELPLVNKLSQKLNSQKVEVIGVDVDEDINKAQQFQKELGLHFKVINDPEGEIIRVFDPVGMPAIYIVRAGKIKTMILGAKDNIDQMIEAALNGEP